MNCLQLFPSLGRYLTQASATHLHFREGVIDQISLRMIIALKIISRTDLALTMKWQQLLKNI